MKQVEPIYGEDYKVHWGYMDYTRKRILDLGADKGSTAYWFLEQGALSVVAVEKDPKLRSELARNIKGDPRVTLGYLTRGIETQADLEYLICKHRPHVVKMDIEGKETVAFDMPRSTVRVVDDYMVETHSAEIRESMKGFLSGNGYGQVWVYHLPLPGSYDVVHGWRIGSTTE